MSGGSWDYFFDDLTRVANRLCGSEQPERRALGKELRLFVPALRAIEWVDSLDMESPADSDAIRVALGSRAEALIVEASVERAREVLAELSALVERAAP